jgi:heptosyltransferase-3
MKSRAILFRIGGLGDLLVALPAISLVRRRLPGFSLTLAGRPEYGALFKQAGVVDEVLSFEDARMAALFAGGCPSGPGVDEKTKIEKRGAAPLDGFGLAMGWLNRPSDWPATEWWAKQGIRRSFFVSYENGAAVPISRFFFDLTYDFLERSQMSAVAAPSPDKLFEDCARLSLPGDLRKKALADFRLRELGKDERRLIVHPGSGGRAKRWPLPSFIEVIRRAASLGLEGVLVTGEAEADLETPFQASALPAGWTRVSRLPAETLAGLLAGSTHYLGNDSGPTHLAAACGASVLALFREDSLPAWRPFGKTRIIAAPALSGIPPEAVLAALGGFLAS